MEQKKQTVRIFLPPRTERFPTVRINLPPKPSSPALMYEGRPSKALRSYVEGREELLRTAYGLNDIAFASTIRGIVHIDSHENRETLKRRVEERYRPAHQNEEIYIGTIDEVLHADLFNPRGAA